MTVRCPHCSTGYLLPDHLMGARGARVRCPHCRGAFLVAPEAGPAGERGEGPAVFREAPSDAASRSDAPDPLPAARRMREGDSSAAVFPPAPEPGSARPVAPAEEPAAVAGAVFDVLASILDDALARSRARGTVLSEHGPAIMAVWGEYRQRAGAGASAAVFRAALRDRCGVDLSPPPRV